MDLQEDLLTALLHSLLSEHCPPDVDDGGGVGDCADPDVEVAALHQPVLHAGHHVAGVALTVPRCIQILLCITLNNSYAMQRLK